ncbi:MAG: ATP-dependent Clp protease adapter ClpS, partial [Flavobacteriales bacterium]
MQDNRQHPRSHVAEYGQQDWHYPRMNAADQDADRQSEHDVLTAPPELERPPLYAVLLFNDDYTP